MTFVFNSFPLLSHCKSVFCFAFSLQEKGTNTFVFGAIYLFFHTKIPFFGPLILGAIYFIVGFFFLTINFPFFLYKTKEGFFILISIMPNAAKVSLFVLDILLFVQIMLSKPSLNFYCGAVSCLIDLYCK